MSVFGSILLRVGSNRSLKSEDSQRSLKSEDSQRSLKPEDEIPTESARGGLRGFLRKAHSLREMQSPASAAAISLRIRDDDESDDEDDDDNEKENEQPTGGIRGLFRRAASLRGTMGEKQQQQDEPVQPKPLDLEPLLLMTNGTHGKVVFQNLDESLHDDLLPEEGALSVQGDSVPDLSVYKASDEDLTKIHNSYSAMHHQASDVSEGSGEACPSAEECDSELDDSESEEDNDEEDQLPAESPSSAGIRARLSSVFGRGQSPSDQQRSSEEENGPRKRTVAISMLDGISSPPLLDDESDSESESGEEPNMGYMDGSYRERPEQSYDDYYYDERDYPSLLQSDVPLSTIEEFCEEED